MKKSRSGFSACVSQCINLNFINKTFSEVCVCLNVYINVKGVSVHVAAVYPLSVLTDVWMRVMVI